jgi:hypothetical protein
MRFSGALGFTGILASFAVLAPSAARAQSATQLIRMEIRPISRLAVIGTTTIAIPATKGRAQPSVTEATASYAITTNEDNRRITVAIDQPMPEGVTLKMRMDAPAGAQAEDEVVLTTDAQTAVTVISRLNQKDLGIGYSLVTASQAVVPASTTRTELVTLVSGV